VDLNNIIAGLYIETVQINLVSFDLIALVNIKTRIYIFLQSEGF